MNDSTIIFKNTLPNFKIIRILTDDTDHIKAAISEKTRQAPMMFVGMQVVIDLSALDNQDALTLDFEQIKDTLMRVGINPIAIMSDNQQYRSLALAADLGALPVIAASEKSNRPSHANQQTATNHTTTSSMPGAESNNLDHNKGAKAATTDAEPQKTYTDADNLASANHPPHTAQTASENNQVIQQPIRSGQRIYCKGDLTIIGAVSHGAEVIADGNIHVYGILRGRAIAGASGDDSAQIFCQKMAAELVAIAGNYKQLEAIDEAYHNKAVRIGFDGSTIHFQLLE